MKQSPVRVWDSPSISYLVRDAYLKDTQNIAKENKGLSSSVQTVGGMSNELPQATGVSALVAKPGRGAVASSRQ